MRARWLSLHARLTRSIQAPLARASWDAARAEHDSLARWASPGALVAHLASRTGELADKDRVYAALIRVVQARGRGSELAMCVAWLGLWPALDAIYRRWLRGYGREPDELCSAISYHFTSLVRTADLSRIRRVAGTLARSTRREVADEWRRRRHEQSTQSELRDEDLPPAAASDEPPEAIQSWLEETVGAQDASLLLAVTTLGETQHEAGARLGLLPDAARRRFQRAIARARRRIRREGCPIRRSRSAFPH